MNAVAVVCSVVASLFVGMFALPPFETGMWFKTEPTEAALFLVAAVAAAAFVWRDWTCGGVARLTAHPLALPWLVLAVWAGLSGWIDLPFPARSWYGPPETGEGGLWALSVFALTCAALAAWPRHGRELGWSVSVAAVAYLAVLAWDPGLLGRWSNWAGLVAPLVGMAARPRFAGLALALVLTAASHGKGAMVLMFCVMPATWLCLIATSVKAPGLTRAACVAACVAVPIGVTFGVHALDWPSAHSRAMLQLVAWEAVAADPLGVLAHGVGWGGFNDVLLEHWKTLAAVDPTWEGLGAGAFHSHNFMIESLLSLGLPGLGLTLCAAVSVPLCARRDDVVRASAWWSVYLGVSAAWFPLPVVAPFLAVAMAAVSDPGWLRGVDLAPRRSAVLAAAAVVLALGGYQTAHVSRQASDLWRRVLGQAPEQAQALTMDDGRRGGTHLWWMVVTVELDLQRRARAGEPLPVDELRWRWMLRDLAEREMAAGRAGARLRMVDQFGPYR